VVLISGRNGRRVLHGALNIQTGELVKVVRELQWFFRTKDITRLPAETLLNTELPGLLPLVPFTQDADNKIIERARQQLPTALPRKQMEQLETLLRFFWEYVHAQSATDQEVS